MGLTWNVSERQEIVMNNDKIELHVHVHVEESRLENMTIGERMRMYERTLRPAVKEWIERGMFVNLTGTANRAVK